MLLRNWRFIPQSRYSVLPRKGTVSLYNPATGQLMQTLDNTFYSRGLSSEWTVLGTRWWQQFRSRGVKIYKLVTANRLDVNKDGRVI